MGSFPKLHALHELNSKFEIRPDFVNVTEENVSTQPVDNKTEELVELVQPSDISQFPMQVTSSMAMTPDEFMMQSAQ